MANRPRLENEVTLLGSPPTVSRSRFRIGSIWMSMLMGRKGIRLPDNSLKSN